MLSTKLILIGLLGALAVGLLVLYRRPERKPPRLGRPLRGDADGGGADGGGGN